MLGCDDNCMKEETHCEQRSIYTPTAFQGDQVSCESPGVAETRRNN